MLKTKEKKNTSKKTKKKNNRHISKTLSQSDIFVETTYQYSLNTSISFINCFEKVHLDILFTSVEILFQILAPTKVHPQW